jgi:hypothetical protein
MIAYYPDLTINVVGIKYLPLPRATFSFLGQLAML